MADITTVDGTVLAKCDETGFSVVHAGVEVLRFNKSGVILVEGVFVAQNRKAVYGLRELLKNIESGNIKET